MFGPLGLPELIFIMVLALLIFGPRKLPEIGRTLGRGLSEFRKASNELKRTVDAEMMREELRQNDPRRLLREEPKPRRAAENPVKRSDADEKIDRRAQPSYEAPEATVARGSVARGSEGTPEGSTDPETKTDTNQTDTKAATDSTPAQPS